MKRLKDLNKNFSNIDIEKLFRNRLKKVKGGSAPPTGCWTCHACNPGHETTSQQSLG